MIDVFRPMVVPPLTDQPMRDRLTPYRCAGPGCTERFTDMNMLLPAEKVTICKKCKTINALRIIVVYMPGNP